MAIDVAAGLAGGCQCGAVRYRLTAEPNGATLCHCRMCQKASGGPFMAFAGVNASDFVVTRGVLATFASSDIAERGFCAECGTPLTYRGLTRGRVSVTLCSLDDPEAVKPETQIGVESRLLWLKPALGAPETRSEQWLARVKIPEVRNRQHPDRDI